MARERTVRSVLLVVSVTISLNVAALAAELETIAFTGDSAPEGPVGAVFLEFGLSQINDEGIVEFVAAMEPGIGGVTLDDAIGIWKGTSGSLTGVTVGDPPAPEIADALFETLISIPQFDNAGTVVAEFQLELGPGGVTANDDIGLWQFKEGGDELIYREGSSLPGFANDAELSLGVALANESGNVAILGIFRDGVGGITTENNRGMWLKTGATPTLLAQSGGPAPGGPAGSILDSFGINDFNDNDSIFARGSLREGVGGVTADDSEVIYSSRSGAFTLEYREGDVASGAAVFDLFVSLAANNQDQLAINGLLKQGIGGVGFFDDRGIWAESDGGLREVARSDQLAPGLDSRKFRAFSDFVLNDIGRVAFAASTVSIAGFDSIFSEGLTGELQLVASEFAEVPGMDPDVSFDFDFSDFPGVPNLSMNNIGQVAFEAGLVGPGITTVNDFGLWAQDAQGALELIVLEGDLIEVGQDDFRVVESFNFGGMNERGQIVFDTIFTDSTSGVFLSNLVATSPGDFTGNDIIDGLDFLRWQRGQSPNPLSAADYAEWELNFGELVVPFTAASTAVPEPATALLLLIGIGCVALSAPYHCC